MIIAYVNINLEVRGTSLNFTGHLNSSNNDYATFVVLQCVAWWYKTEYIINELNINSAITTPSHEEILPINSWTTQRPFTLKGYAYSGEFPEN